MQAIHEMAPVIATIMTHCPGTHAREEFVRACLGAEWADTRALVEGMLAEPWHLKGYQESRLREFLELVQLEEGALVHQ